MMVTVVGVAGGSGGHRVAAAVAAAADEGKEERSRQAVNCKENTTRRKADMYRGDQPGGRSEARTTATPLAALGQDTIRLAGMVIWT